MTHAVTRLASHCFQYHMAFLIPVECPYAFFHFTVQTERPRLCRISCFIVAVIYLCVDLYLHIIYVSVVLNIFKL